MEVTTKELRIQPGKIIEQVNTGQEITVTYRGKPLAKLVPLKESFATEEDISIFGMWKNHENNKSVDEQVREMRKGRQF